MQNKSTKKQLIVIFLTVFIYLLSFGIVIPIIPLLGQRLGANSTQVGLLMATYSFMQFIFSPLWGRMSDKWGRRPILIFCLLGEGLSYLIFAYARDLNTFFLSRALAGIFAGSISTASAYIADITPKNERSKGMALIGAAFGLGFLIGPALGGFLSLWSQKISQEAFFDTSFVAYWVVVICVVSFVFAYFNLSESLSKENRSSDSVQKKRFLILFENLKRPTVGVLMFTFFMASFAMSSMEATLILFVNQKFNWTIKEVSFGFAYIGVIMLLTQGYLVRKLIKSWGESKMLLVGLSFFTLGLLLISFAPTIAILGLAMTLFAIGNGFTNPSINGSISLLTPAQDQGSTFGSTQSLASLARILGPVTGGILFTYNINLPFLFSSLIAFMALIIIFKMKNKIISSGKTSEA